MILTGKAKESFEMWLYDQGVTGQIDLSNFEFDKFQHLIEISQHGIIISWLDSVGIYIELSRFTHGLKFEFWHFVISDSKGIHFNNHLHNILKVDSRHQATEQSTIKAIEIYNEKNIGK